MGFRPIHTFQACAFDRSAIPPCAAADYIGRRASEKKFRGEPRA
jgi:hypothetical protein